MKPVDLIYIEKCTKVIEDNVGLGEIKTWKQRNYEKLCDLIFEKTNVSLSLSTVKRILNKDINYLPQKVTLDTLAKFIGYANWFDFTKQYTELHYNNFKNNKAKLKVGHYFKRPKLYYIISFIALILLITGVYYTFISTKKTGQNSSVSFMATVDTITGKKFSGLALTPPMGWNSWNSFCTQINEKLIKDIVDKLIESGMRNAGYQYVIIDDGWQAISRDPEGNLTADTSKFPGGMKALADYIHSKGLKFGIYSCTGSQSWSGSPGGRGHEFQDAKTFASWGVDYLKYDWSSKETTDAPGKYRIMRDAVYSSGRPILFSICEWGSNSPWLWGKDVGHMWRTTGDITDCFDCKETYAIGWKNILDKQAGLAKFAGPGHWNDPDMLEVGNPGLSLKESKAHFSMWCMLAAPLIAGNDLRTMPKEIQQILTNKEAIAIDQDSLGKQGYRFCNQENKEIWIKELSGGNWAICCLNTGKSIMSMQIKWKDFDFLNGEYKIRNIWKAEFIGTIQTPLNIEIKSNEVLLLKLIKLQCEKPIK